MNGRPGDGSSARSTGGDAPELVERFRVWRHRGDRRLRDELVVEHRSIAEACARRFADRGEPLEDLTQVALLGLVKSVERFDPDKGVPFAGFAVPTDMGELRRHFRDTTWAVHVPRRAKDLHVRLPKVVERLTNDLGRSPTAEELAQDMGVAVDDVLDAIEAGAAYRTSSVDTPEGEAAVGRVTPGTGGLGEDRLLLRSLLETLPEREREIVWLRFFEDLSQAEIGERIGTSQVHVSRLLRRSLRQLHERAGSLEG